MGQQCIQLSWRRLPCWVVPGSLSRTSCRQSLQAVLDALRTMVLRSTQILILLLRSILLLERLRCRPVWCVSATPEALRARTCIARRLRLRLTWVHPPHTTSRSLVAGSEGSADVFLQGIVSFFSRYTSLALESA